MSEIVTGVPASGLLRRLSARIGQQFARRVAWVTSARRDLFGTATEAGALVAVLGREHYAERRKTYPIRGIRELASVLREELRDGAPRLTLIGPEVEDRREVTFFELAPGALERCGRAPWIVPESVLLARTLEPQQVAVVERDGLTYYVASHGMSQVAGGTLRSSGLFALAAGLDPDRPAVDIAADAIPARLQEGLRRLGPGSWLRLRNPAIRLDLGLAWRPLTALAAGALIVYLLLASGYLSLTERVRQRALEGLGPEVETLLGAQREVVALTAEQQAIAKVMGERRPTHVIWRVAAVAWQKGAAIDGFSYSDGKLNLRGRAPAATDVLAAIAASPGVTDARFGAPVRQAGTGVGEEFTINLTLAGAVGD